MGGDRADELRTQIVKAFSARPYPGDDQIGLADDRFPDYEGHEVARFFRGKPWERITFRSLSDEYPADPTAVLRFMRDEGLLYYLPAFLRMTLEPAAAEMTEAVCFALTDRGPEKRDDSKRFRARMAGLSVGERAAVVAVLRHLAERYDRDGEPSNPAREALRSYWEPTPDVA